MCVRKRWLVALARPGSPTAGDLAFESAERWAFMLFETLIVIALSVTVFVAAPAHGAHFSGRRLSMAASVERAFGGCFSDAPHGEKLVCSFAVST